MAERFSRLFQLGQDLYVNGSPVVISAGVLLKDNDTGAVVAQLKLQSICKERISAAKVKLCAYDVSGGIIEGVDDYQYLDLDVHTGDYWGADKAIMMPDAVARSFSVEQIAILFSGEKVWKTVDFTSSASLPKGVPLEQKLTDPELVAQYRLEVNQSARFVPQQYGDVWRCPCGTINQGESCHNCHAAKSVVFSSFDLTTLSEHAKKHAEEERVRQAVQKKQRQARAKKLKLAAAICVPIVALVLVFALWIVPDVINPHSRYSNACALLEAGQYDEAIEIFENLGDYRDAPEMIQAAQYAHALELAESGNADGAVAILQSLGDYEDSVDQIKAVRYAQALELAKSGDTGGALTIFQSLEGYRDSADQAKAIQYAKAVALADEGRYAKAVEIFKSLGSYEDAAERIVALQDSTLSDFVDCVQSGQYEAASSVKTDSVDIWTEEMREQAETFAESRYRDLVASGQGEEATRLSETLQLSPERDYIAAKELLLSRDYESAYKLLETIPDYKCSSQMLSAIENRVDSVYSHDDMFYMWVTTIINTETGDYSYRGSRWCSSNFSHFSQGALAQTRKGIIEGDYVFVYAGNYFRWTFSPDKAQIVAEEIYGLGLSAGEVKETITWTRLDDETAADVLRLAKYEGLV